MSNSYFITTAIPYVNSQPHFGHAQEFLIADALVRWHRRNGAQVTFQSGTDDNAYKNVLSAQALRVDPTEFINQNSQKFQDLQKALGVFPDYFVRTLSKEHIAAVELFLTQLKDDDIYQKAYKGHYCQGCEDFLTERDLVSGLCPDHKLAPTVIEEENIFFKLSKYQKDIFKLIDSDQVKITPAVKKKEILNFITVGLTDISLSRCSERSEGWGIAFPGHPKQVVYIWIDALINYLSGVGYGQSNDWQSIWNERTHKTHIVGKNVWKFHAIYWIGLLLSAGLPLPNEILIHGFLTHEGEKISKSLGNGGDPLKVIDQYGADAVRFYILNSLSLFEDSNFSEESLRKVYDSELANKLGNLVSRVLALQKQCHLSLLSYPGVRQNFSVDFKKDCLWAFEEISLLNSEINDRQPWSFLRSGREQELKGYLEKWLLKLGNIQHLLIPIIPHGAAKLAELLQGAPATQLYPRLDRS